MWGTVACRGPKFISSVASKRKGVLKREHCPVQPLHFCSRESQGPFTDCNRVLYISFVESDISKNGLDQSIQKGVFKGRGYLCTPPIKPLARDSKSLQAFPSGWRYDMQKLTKQGDRNRKFYNYHERNTQSITSKG